MPFAEDLTLGPIEQVNPPIPEKVAATKAFYAAATNEESDDPISEYQTIKSELESQGYSNSLESAQNKWIKEQDEFGKEYFSKLISDPNVDVKTKKDALSLYASSGYINPSLREKYVEQVAVKSLGDRVSDEKALDELLKAFPERRNQSIKQTLKQDIDASELGIKDWAKASGYVGLDIIKSIPATVWGAIQGIWDKDPITAREVTANLVQNWSSNPQDPKVQSAYNTIMDKLSFFEIPYDTAFSETLKNTGSAKGAVISGVLGEAAAGYIIGTPLIAGVRSLLKVKKPKGIPEIKKGTPLDETVTANPKAGATVATEVVKDTTGQMSTATGASAGEIIRDMGLPRPFKMDRNRNLPSIHKRLAADIKKLDEQFIKEFEYFRWDASIYDVDTRKADYDLITKTTMEVDTPTYQPSNSTISPTNTSTYVGKAVFGRDTDLFYHSRSEVINAYDRLVEVTKNIPEEFNTKISIVDRLTGDKYTPESLRAEPKFMSGLDKLNLIPSITESGIPVRTGNTGKTRADGTYVPATLKKNPDGSPKEIVIDVDTIKTQFNNKPWTNPKVEGVNPLPAKAFRTPEEWAKFVYLHEEAHITYPNTNGVLSKAEYENLVNQKALEKFNSIRDEAWQSPALSAKQFAVEMEWNREYDDLSIITFGTNAIKAQMEFGVDVSGLARSSLSQWIFGGYNIFPRWFEQSGARATQKAARQASTFINAIKKKISSTPFNKELSSLIEKAEAEGIESYTIGQIQDLFPSLKMSEVESLFETHTYWRRVIHYQHALINWTKRNELLEKDFKNGLYIEGTYSGPINAELTFFEDNIAPDSVWDFDKNFAVKFTKDTSKDFATDLGGKKLVMLSDKFTDPTDPKKVYEYALVGGENSKIELLPDQVVPRVPGYSPIKTKASWYIDIIPNELEINGYLTKNDTLEGTKRLRQFAKTIAAGTSELDIRKLERELKQKYPDYTVQARQEKNITFDRIIADREAHQQVLRNAKQRGERLPTLNGPAPIEDRLTSLVDTVQTLTRQNNFQAFEKATESAFVKDYALFLKGNEFPVNRSDIQLPELATPEMITQYENALTIWDQYAKIKSFGSMGDRKWSEVLNKVADKLENYKVTYKTVPGVRKLAEQGNVLVNFPRQLASTLFISLNAPRQWIVQHGPLVEMFAINPTTAIQRFVDLSAIRLALISKSELMTKSPIDFYNAARSIAPSMDKVEFDKTVKAIEDSGLLESVDLNMMAHGLFNDLDRPLIEGTWEKLYNDIKAGPKAIVSLSRQVGFDFAEKNNQIGTWLIMKDKWIEKNPGKDWTNKKAVDEITYETWKWTGAMSRAGSYPYQEGAWGALLQFGAITQKLTMNLLMKNELLSPLDKARLIAARAVLWGAKTGVPFGAALYYYIDRMADDDEENKEIKQYANELKRGLSDRMMNELFDALSGTEGADLATGQGLSPYGESTTGMVAVDTYIEFAKLFDGNEATSPRIPAIGATATLLETIGRVRSWFVTKDITDENMFKRTLLEAVHVASGMNNAAKMQLMLSTKEKITRSGNKYGLNFTAGEAFAQALGLNTWKELEMWDGLSASMDRKTRIEDMAGNIHNWLTYQMSTMKSEDPIMRYEMLVSFTTMLKDDKNWVDQDIQELYEAVLEKSKRSSKNTSAFLFETYLKAHREKNSAELERAKTALREIPRYKKLIDIIENKGNI